MALERRTAHRSRRRRDRLRDDRPGLRHEDGGRAGRRPRIRRPHRRVALDVESNSAGRRAWRRHVGKRFTRVQRSRQRLVDDER